MTSKILVVGAVEGQLKSTFAKITALHSKNAFTLALIVGNLFLEDDDVVADLLSGNITIPVSTYFTVGTRALPQSVIDRLSSGEELCENLHYLGKRSTTKTVEGIRIVALGGALDEAIVGGTSKEQYLPYHTVDDAKALRGANTADILLTSTWPAAVHSGSKIPLPDAAAVPTGQQHISELCQALRPRYHFSTSPHFYFEREPFYHKSSAETPDARPVTRFISLAAFGNPAKQKSVYAFSLPANADLLAPLPYGTTNSPFTSQVARQKRAALEPAPYTRFSNEGNHKHQRRSKRDRLPPPGPDACFFCLSNPNIGTHLVASIGEDAYLTVAKGTLTTPSTNTESNIEFTSHMLIIPLTHEPTLALNPDIVSREKTYKEMTSYRIALQNMVAIQSTNKLGTVTYEISRANGVHTHWQFLPISLDLLQKGLVEAAFRIEAENLRYPSFEIKDVGLGQGEGDFFRVWIWTPPSDDDEKNDGKTTCLFMPLDDGARFDLQLGRRVLAKLLGLEKRLQWRDCTETLEEETADVEAFKVAFKEFDFTS